MPLFKAFLISGDTGAVSNDEIDIAMSQVMGEELREWI